MSTLTEPHVAMQKFRFSTYAGGRVRAVAQVQSLVDEAATLGRKLGCQSAALFNYTYYWGDKAAVDALSVNFSVSEQRVRSRLLLGRNFGEAGYPPDHCFASWILTVADRANRLSGNRPPVGDQGVLLMGPWLATFADAPLPVQAKATFAPTIKVSSSDGFEVRNRSGYRLDLGKLEHEVVNGPPDAALCMLDVDGMNRPANSVSYRSLFGVHLDCVANSLNDPRNNTTEAMYRIYQSRMRLDGIFEDFAMRLVGSLERDGFWCQYFGGDEFIAIAPLEAIRSAVYSVMAEDVILSFSCGAVRLKDVSRLDDGFTLLDQRLLKAKALAPRSRFNVVLDGECD